MPPRPLRALRAHRTPHAVRRTQGNFKGSQYIDKTAKPPAELTAASDTITISKETDSVYAHAQGARAVSRAHVTPRVRRA